MPYLFKSEPVGAKRWSPPSILEENVSLAKPKPKAAISAAVIQAFYIMLPHLSIFSSQSGNSFGITFGISLAISLGLSPIAQLKRHLASNSGGNLDKGLFSSVMFFSINSLWFLAFSYLSVITPVLKFNSGLQSSSFSPLECFSEAVAKYFSIMSIYSSLS